MNAAHNKSSTVESKRETYRAITERFHPVMRYFFMDHFKGASEWYQQRQQYTKSVAVSSIVGYVVGLGDRHPHNILLDLHTSQVIHIDLGIAFDQGKLLPMPERVPFRLTRDIVDGMGMNGVRGTFTTCCEITLSTLIDCKHVIMAVLDVLKYDPLYQWTISPVKRQQTFDDSLASTFMDTQEKEPVVGEADRALASVRRKLSPQVSVPCQVNDLILSASDDTNLAQMFSGKRVVFVLTV
jgi:ataxia telangiectasia mutated family protein